MTAFKIRKGILSSFIASAFLLTPSMGVFAATDGEPGETSTGTTDIQLVVPKLLRVRIFNDIDLGTYNGDDQPRSGTAGACVQGNDGFAYQITATSASGSGDFKLTPDGTQSTNIAYQVNWDSTALSHGIAAAPFSLDETTLGPPCAEVTDKVAVTVPAWADDDAVDSMGAAQPGTYTDTLTLLVEPQ